MSHIAWDESFCIDNAEIDEQHKKWFEIHNRLHTILLEGNVDSLQGARSRSCRTCRLIPVSTLPMKRHI